MPKLLLVEDDSMLMQSLKRLFAAFAADWTLDYAENGREAIQLLEGNPVDLLVTDLQMPVMDGFELLALLIGRQDTPPIIVMSGAWGPEAEAWLQFTGNIGCLLKPVPFRVLLGEIRMRLAQREQGPVSRVQLSDLLALLQMERKSGILQVQGAEGQGQMDFFQGELVEASTGNAQGLNAVEEILTWNSPQVQMSGKSRGRDLATRWSVKQVLLNAMRRSGSQLALLFLPFLFWMFASTAVATEVYLAKSEAQADFKIYVTDSEQLADCLIHVVDSADQAIGNLAVWHYQAEIGLADVKVFFTDTDTGSDYKIALTRKKTEARCGINWFVKDR